MYIHPLQRWKHRHRYNIEAGHGERNTRRVILLTLSMMIIEITGGYLFGSMALLADYDEIAHVTVEVNSADSDPCLVQPEPAH